ncbi:ATP-dependent Clp protease [Actinidia rufa]|uniref:ATP-dependent Clp protease n=1 Tax=Actinidia rufa TaxID=165716 RepID=A0A7J0GFU3_9ERIC|nr:ATP-dependent Clp protease [Actinidia rufa]
MIAKKAMAKNTGARGLRALLESILTEAMYEIPDVKTGNDRVDAVVIDEESVGSVNSPGCGGKILCGDGALEHYLAEARLKYQVLLVTLYSGRYSPNIPVGLLGVAGRNGTELELENREDMLDLWLGKNIDLAICRTCGSWIVPSYHGMPTYGLHVVFGHRSASWPSPPAHVGSG